MKRLLLVCGLVLTIACNQSTVAEPVVIDLVDTIQFADVFNSVDPEAVQVILLLSPT